MTETGARAANWGKSRINQMLLALQRFRILALGGDTALRWAGVRYERDQLGMPIAAQDAWIAATALHERCALMTHNVKHFQQIAGLQLFTLDDTSA